MLDLWLKLLLPVGVCTEAEIVKAHRIESIVEYFNEVIFANRSSGFFGAVGLKYFGYGFELLSAPLGGFGFDNGVDSILNILRRRIGVDVNQGGTKKFEAVLGVGARRTFGPLCSV